LVLERVNDRPKGAFVRAHGPGAIDGAVMPAASRAPRECQAHDPPGRQWVAAHLAQRWGERKNGRPAAAADRPEGRLVQRLTAGGTARREEHGQERIDQGPGSTRSAFPQSRSRP
jgi:hypothetical protein